MGRTGGRSAAGGGYARLDELDQAYLDYTGGGLYAASQLREHQELLGARIFGNPHSTSPTSATSTAFADEAATAFGVSVRTGCFCNPGASEAARGMTAGDMRRVFALGHQPSFEELRALLPGKALGAVRASVGIATVERDLDRLLAVLATFAGE